jgi:hypothetical protein
MYARAIAQGGPVSQRAEKESFVPKGAIATFVAMVAFYAVLWSILYLVMAQRG